MTVKGALKAKQAGAAAIVVSNHGGRVLDQCPATAEVLPEIAAALKGTGVKVLVDGGIRTGMDVFKALALGADAVLIGRPFVTMVYGAGAEGVKTYVEKLGYTLPETLTWDFIWEVSEAAAKKDENGVYKVNGQKVMIPFIYKSTDNMMIQMLRQKGAGYSTPSGRSSSLTIPPESSFLPSPVMPGPGPFPPLRSPAIRPTF